MEDCGFELVDLREHHLELLLRKFYEHLYLPAFPIANEREHPGIWAGLLRMEKPVPPTPILHCFLLGHNLKRPEYADIIGGTLLEYYQESNCGLLTYLVVSPRYRGNGLARLLLRRAFLTLEQDASNMGKKLEAVFGEANNPTVFSSNEDSMSPNERLRILSHLGAKILDLPYVQPELVGGEGRARNMLLLSFRHKGIEEKSISRCVIECFLNEFYRALGICEPEKDPDFQNILAHMEKHGEFVRLKEMLG